MQDVEQKRLRSIHPINSVSQDIDGLAVLETAGCFVKTSVYSSHFCTLGRVFASVPSNLIVTAKLAAILMQLEV